MQFMTTNVGQVWFQISSIQKLKSKVITRTEKIILEFSKN